ncbi:hypothetical protein FTG_1441 [Francisella tularensis subsp. novicida FTG]|nr:hypothetical protein FTG_1441 [Francisella tularensis subsp. novicida FTG]
MLSLNISTNSSLPNNLATETRIKTRKHVTNLDLTVVYQII